MIRLEQVKIELDKIDSFIEKKKYLDTLRVPYADLARVGIDWSVLEDAEVARVNELKQQVAANKAKAVEESTPEEK